MKKRLLIIIGLTLMGVLVCSVAFAQGSQQQVQNRFQYEFERTEQVINQAKNTIAESNTEKGKALLDMAIQLQNQARTMGQNHMCLQGATTT